MPSISASILQSINRDCDRPLNILCINHKEAYQNMLSRTGHNFYFMYHPKLSPWNAAIRPIPNNCHLLTGDKQAANLRYDVDFDLIVCQDKDTQYPILLQVAKQLCCPMLNLEYSLTDPNANPYYVENLMYQNYNLTVFSSEFVSNSWGADIEDEDVKIIPHGIDTDFFTGWTGGDGKILTIVNNYQQRNNTMGFDLFTQIAKCFTMNPLGHTQGVSRATKNVDELLSAYQKADVYINTSTWHACPMTLLEAMSVGCPVVTTGSAMLTEIVEDGVNGFIADDIDTMKTKIQNILDDPDMTKEMGQKARQTIIDGFGSGQFIKNWQEVLLNVIDQPSCVLTS
ncbi:hypothetical protein LCGC14_2712880 [marine sediment metagenome]|uniref:Glycosyl transferase family 1 domain-containing protein n=1 Tax=marine sediment metagenome TaxID=412755 RepID=A0A0F8ZCI7_9ZZZZ